MPRGLKEDVVMQFENELGELDAKAPRKGEKKRLEGG